MKKIVSLLLSIIIMFNFTVQTVAAYGDELVRTYESGGCAITYTIVSEWTGNRQISVSVKNKTEETIRNWALKLDSTGEITNIWNASVYKTDGKLWVIKNNGYNYEIAPGGIVEFGFQIAGDDLNFPENISLCNKTVDATDSAEFSFEIQDHWDTGFVASISVTNTSDEALEAWRLSFKGNFEITGLWNANRLEADEGFLVENDVTTMHIGTGETKAFSFQGEITSGETPAVSDFVLTSVVIDSEAEQPDTPTEYLILCFGQYIKEENAIDVYCSSTAEGIISIYEKDGDWIKIVDVENGTSYKYEIIDDFSVKQIKAVQETDKGTIESEPFTIEPAEDGYTCTWLDSDEDGIPDYAESIYGTDPRNPDTDSDGLTDYEEIYLIGTNPLKYDTDENGVNDADDDADSDGLTNKSEIELGTNPSNPDTDGDEISDGDEVGKYGTDPLKADSDDDTLTDGDEVALGLDPNNPETFGVPDAEYKFEQKISASSEILSEINSEEAPYELSLEISASGNAGKHLTANTSVYSAVTESGARIGEAVDLSYVKGEVDNVKLIYEINDDLISNNGSEYAENCVDLQGIKRYNIFKYIEDLNMLLPVKTQFDEENNTLYAETYELGTYCLMDMEILLQQLNISPYGEAVEGEARPTLLSAYAADDFEEDTSELEEKEKDPEKDPFCVTFIFDIRKDKIGETQLNKMKDEVSSFAKEVAAFNPNTTICLITQDAADFEDSSFKVICESAKNPEDIDNALDKITVSRSRGVFGDYCIISEALEYAVNSSSASVNNYIFDFYDQEEAIFEDNISDELLEKIKSRNVNFSVISAKDESVAGYQAMLADITDGIIIDKTADITYKKLYQHVYNKKVVHQSFSAILITGYQYIELEGKLSKYNGIDTDRDTMTDWDEVGIEYWTEKGLITYDGSGNMMLPTIEQCLRFSELSYVEEGLERFQSGLGVNFGTAIAGARVLPIMSDPMRTDGDEDGLEDIVDDYPLYKNVVIDDEAAVAIQNFFYDYLGMIMPPVYTESGEIITPENKQCKETKEYFDTYIWPYLKLKEFEKYNCNPNYEHFVDQQKFSAYIAWIRDVYGVNGLEAFWTSTSDYTSALISALVEETSDMSELIQKVLNQVLLGNYSDDITVTGTAGQIVLGFSGIDFVADIRDLTWDVTHWEFNLEHFAQTGLDAIALVPVVGVIKNLGSVKNLDELAVMCKSLDKVSDTIKCTEKTQESIRKIINASKREDLVKNLDIWVNLSTHNNDSSIVVLGKFKYNNVSYDDVAKKIHATYYSNPFYSDLANVISDDDLWEINKTFLKNQIDAGKTIIFSHNPNANWGKCGFTKEIKFLRDNGYYISKTVNLDGYYYAIPNK